MTDERNYRQRELNTNRSKQLNSQRQHSARPASGVYQSKRGQGAGVPANKRVKRRAAGKNVRARFHAGTLVAFLVTVFLFVYIIGFAYTHINRQSVATVEIKHDSIDTHMGTVHGIVIRHEELLASDTPGEVHFTVNDKERIKKGAEVFQVRDPEQAVYIEKNIEDINGKINSSQNRRSDLSLFYKDALRINSQIKDFVEKNMYRLVGADAGELYKIKDGIIKNINIRNDMLLTENKGSVEELIDDKSYYENELGKYIRTVSSAKSGIVSYYADNLEEVFSVDLIEDFTYEQISMKSQFQTYANKNIEAEKGAARIVTDNEWFIAGYVDNEYIEGIERGDSKSLYIQDTEDSQTLDMTVYFIKRGGERSYIVFQSTKNIIDYMDKRSISFKLSESVRRGLKIPDTSMVDRTFVKVPESFVKDNAISVRSASGAEKITVSSNSGSADEPGFVYVLFDFSKFSIGDVLLNETGDEYKITDSDLKSLTGIYRANDRTARFVRIDVESMVSAGGYSILDPDKNRSLDIYDTVVVDGANIVENQIIG